ncbi:hypothetical protein TNCV_4165001 [Trichonephila clavipes]|nr:hypothetical protein TNCV_4165001 [Trichonephila clavipes]
MWTVTDWQKVPVINPGLFWGQMIIVYGCGGALGQFSSKIMVVRIRQELLRLPSFRLPWPARLKFVPCRAREKRMPLCHSVHDLELVVQDIPSASGQYKV